MNDFDSEVHKCNLCYNALCSQNNEINIERIIRAIKFDNLKGACYLLNDNINLDDIIMKKNTCIKGINYKKILETVIEEKKKLKLPKRLNVDISTDICGVKLENPYLLSSSVVGSNYDMCKRALDAGWAGVVFKTICLMDIHETSPRFSTLKDWDNSFIGFKNIEQLSEHSLEENLDILKRLKKEYPNKVIVASIMGRNKNEWSHLTKKVSEANVDVIELNFSCPNMEIKGTGSDVGINIKKVFDYTLAARKSTKKPILVKMTPNITKMNNIAKTALRAGANGISAINTIKSITNIDLSSLVPEPCVNEKTAIGGYSGRAVKPIALRFISELTSDEKLKKASISGIGGIYTWHDALEFLLLGAKNVQITTAIMEYGYRIIDDLILGLKIYMKENNINNLDEIIGKSKKHVTSLDDLERDTILFPKFNQDKCIGCGRCYISCQDGGHQAIKFNCENRKPTLDVSKCVGCHLCKLVCPMNAISTVPKRIKK